MKLIILDRDGVINHDSDAYIKSVEEWLPIDGSIDAIARLSKAGFTVAIATNQSGLGRGFFSSDDLQAMHDKLLGLVKEAGGEISGIYYCPHHPDDGCNCRKPNPGLIDQIEKNLNVSAQGAVMIGDSLRDLQAGIIKGCQPILVKTGKGKKTLSELRKKPEPDLDQLCIYNNLAAATDALIGAL